MVGSKAGVSASKEHFLSRGWLTRVDCCHAVVLTSSLRRRIAPHRRGNILLITGGSSIAGLSPLPMPVLGTTHRAVRETCTRGSRSPSASARASTATDPQGSGLLLEDSSGVSVRIAVVLCTCVAVGCCDFQERCRIETTASLILIVMTL